MSNSVNPHMATARPSKKEVASMFDSIAPRYDMLNHLLSGSIDRVWRRKLLKPLRGSATRILDVATGTGDLAIMEAAMIPGAKITGVDISSGMLAKAALKVKKKGLENRITLMEGDVEQLPFEVASFDAATVAFGVRNFENLSSGLSEIRRVLTPGGTLAVLEFGKPRRRFFRSLYRFYSGRILPYVGGTVARDFSAYKYLPESINAFPHGEAFMYHMRLVGFKNCHCRPLSGGIAYVYYGTR